MIKTKKQAQLIKLIKIIVAFLASTIYLIETTGIVYAQTKKISTAILSSVTNEKTTRFSGNKEDNNKSSKVKGVKLTDDQKDSLVSNAFNFKNLYGSSVDPRTGSYEFHAVLGKLASSDGNSPDFQLQAFYSQNSNSDFFGIGKGWNFNLTHFSSKSGKLTLGSGGTFKVNFDRLNQPYLQYYKLLNLRIERDLDINCLFKLYFKDGHIEVINKQGFISKIIYPRGDIFYFSYSNQNILTAITNGKNSINFNFNSGNFVITSFDTYGNKISTVINKTNNQLTSIQLPEIKNSGNKYSIGFKYALDQRTNSNLLYSILYPTGLTESLVYTSIPVPTGGPIQYLNVVKSWVKDPGFGQGALKTNFSYGTSNDNRNFLGFASGIPFQANVDNLYERGDNYFYTTREDNGVTSVTHIYNKYHLEVDKKIFSIKNNILLQEEKKYYPDTSGKSINDSDFPLNYELPIKTENIYFAKNVERHVVNTANYDNYGNEILSTNNYGITRKTLYCPLEGNEHCPQSNTGFVSNPEIVVTYPSQQNSLKQSSLNSVSPKVQIYTYKNLQPMNQEALGFFVLVKKESGFSNVQLARSDKKIKDKSWNIFQTESIEYNENMADKNNYGLEKSVTDMASSSYLKSSLLSVRKDISYSFEDNVRTKIETIEPKNYLNNSVNLMQEKSIFSAYSGKLIETSSPAKTAIKQSFDEMGRITSEVVAPDTSFEKVKTYFYKVGKDENSVTIISPNGFTVKHYYDGLGREIKVESTNPENFSNSFNENLVNNFIIKYDNYGRVFEKDVFNSSSSGEEIVNKSFYQYDEMGRNIKTINPDGSSQVTIYNDAYSQNSSAKYSYSLSSENQKLYTSVSVLDNSGNLIESDILDVNNSQIISKSTKEYDSFSREFRNIDVNGNAYEINYDDVGNPFLVQNPNKNKQYRLYDMLGNVVETGIINANGEKKCLGKREFNSFGKLLWEIDANNNLTSYNYNNAGNLVTVKKANGFILHFEYDTLGINIVKKWVENDTNNVYSTYYQYDAKTNLLTSIQDLTGTTFYTYYLNKKLAMVSHNKDSSVPGFQTPAYSLNYKYDRLGQLISFQDANGNITIYNRDIYGKLTTVLFNSIPVANYLYDNFGRLVETQIFNKTGNSLLASNFYKYNFYNQLIEQENKLSFNQTSSEQIYSFVKYNYVYYNNGLLKNRLQTDANNNQTSENYSYDDSRNLKEYQCDGLNCPFTYNKKQIKKETYNFDTYNNISSVSTVYLNTQKELQTNITTYYYDSINPTKLVSYTNSISEFGNSKLITYDKENHIISDDQGNKYTYDPFGNMICINFSSGEFVKYGYDGNGLQVWKQAFNENPIYYIYSNGNVINEKQGDLTASYIIGLNTIAKILADSTLLYFSYDQSLNVIATFTENSASVAVINDQYFYSPYGVETSLSSLANLNNKKINVQKQSTIDQKAIGFDGQRTDSTSGYQFLGNGYRAYNPMLKRFMAYDSASPFDKGGINGFIFASNNPIFYQDPSGHNSQLLGWLIGGLIGFATGILTGGFGEGAGAVVASLIANSIASAGASIVTDVVNGEKINWKSVAIGVGIGLAADGLGYGLGRAGAKILAEAPKDKIEFAPNMLGYTEKSAASLQQMTKKFESEQGLEHYFYSDIQAAEGISPIRAQEAKYGCQSQYLTGGEFDPRMGYTEQEFNQLNTGQMEDLFALRGINWNTSYIAKNDYIQNTPMHLMQNIPDFIVSPEFTRQEFQKYFNHEPDIQAFALFMKDFNKRLNNVTEN